MKKILITASLLLLTSIVVLPAMAGPYERPSRMMGSEMMMDSYRGSQQTPVDEEKMKAYNEEFAKHHIDIADQQREIIVKRHEMAILLLKTTTTKEELLEKQKELQGLMNALQSEMLSFRWEMNKKYPDMAPDIYRGCLGSGAGFGGAGMMEKGLFGPGMMDREDLDEHRPGMMGTGRGNWRK